MFIANVKVQVFHYHSLIFSAHFPYAILDTSTAVDGSVTQILETHLISQVLHVGLDACFNLECKMKADF